MYNISYDHPKYKEIETRTEQIINNWFNRHGLNVYEKCSNNELYEYIEQPLEVKNGNDIEDYEEYPLWNWIFESRDDFMELNINENLAAVQELGFGVIHPIETKGEHYFNTSLFFKGGGYDFIKEHWIPLFNMLGFFNYILKEAN